MELFKREISFTNHLEIKYAAIIKEVINGYTYEGITAICRGELTRAEFYRTLLKKLLSVEEVKFYHGAKDGVIYPAYQVGIRSGSYPNVTHVIDFIGLYPTIMERLYLRGDLKFSHDFIGEHLITLLNIKRSEYYNSHMSITSKYVVRFLVNYLYFTLVSKYYEYSVCDMSKVTHHLEQFFTNIDEKIIPRINVDLVLINNYNDPLVKSIIDSRLLEIDLPYVISDYDRYNLQHR